MAVALFNLFFIPHQEARECARYGYRATAAGIRRVVGDAQPLYAAGFVDEDFAPLLFYLDRDAPFISTNLAQAPSGYIIVPADFWQTHKNDAPGFEVDVCNRQKAGADRSCCAMRPRAKAKPGSA